VRVAVIGATGVVGETILRVLEERNVPVETLLAYASRERDNAITFKGASLPVAVADRTSRSLPRATTRAPKWRMRSPAPVSS
jgi:aspartate-semialdehyde dehydrogenase